MGKSRLDKGVRAFVEPRFNGVFAPFYVCAGYNGAWECEACENELDGQLDGQLGGQIRFENGCCDI